MIKFACECGKRYDVLDHLAGRVVRCSGCRKELTIPGAPASGQERSAAPPASVVAAARLNPEGLCGPAVTEKPPKTTAGPITFHCPYCYQRFRAEDRARGSTMKCPACGKVMEVPLQNAWEVDDSPPPLPTGKAVEQPTADEPESYRPVPRADREKGRPFWKDPIVVIGAVVPTLILGVFFTYLAWTRNRGNESQPSLSEVAKPGLEGPIRVGKEVPGTSRYEIVERETEGTKDLFWVRLIGKPSREELLRITLELSAQAKAPRVIVWYSLGDGNPIPWAAADCDPEPSVEILGLTADQEAELVSRPLPVLATSIEGRWISDDYTRCLYTLYRRGDVFWLERAGSRESEGTQVELVEMERSALRRFQRKEFSRAGDHYVINGYGDLELRDHDGLIAVARRVR